VPNTGNTAESRNPVKVREMQMVYSKTTYIGLIVSAEGISMDPKKTNAVKKWSTLKSVKEGPGRAQGGH
jgi:hypothetical protein